MVIKRVACWQRFGFGDIEAGAADQPVVQGLEQGLLVQQAATGDVDQVQPGLGVGQHLAVNQATGGGVSGAAMTR